MLDRRLTLPLLTILTAVNLQTFASTVDESFFADRVYPLMQQVQCNLCHNDNGVASDTALDFPSRHAARDEIVVFGLRLMDLIDRDSPEDSILLLKPTNREEHTGGQRISPGSAEERDLIRWINYLAQLDDDQLRAILADMAPLP